MRPNHEKDEDCDVGEDGTCRGCGVSHVDLCGVCGGRGFHREGCSEIEEHDAVRTIDLTDDRGIAAEPTGLAAELRDAVLSAFGSDFAWEGVRAAIRAAVAERAAQVAQVAALAAESDRRGPWRNAETQAAWTSVRRSRGSMRDLDRLFADEFADTLAAGECEVAKAALMDAVESSAFPAGWAPVLRALLVEAVERVDLPAIAAAEAKARAGR